MVKMNERSTHSIRMDKGKKSKPRRSKQDWERGRGAKRKGNPNYKPVRRKGKDGVTRKVYILRDKAHKW